MAGLGQIPTLHSKLYQLGASVAGEGGGAEVVVVLATLWAGLALGAVMSKQAFRLHHKRLYGKTNRDKAPLTDQEVNKLHHKAPWITPDAARKTHAFLVSKAERAEKNKTSKHPEIAAAAPTKKDTAKKAYKALIRACHSDKGDLVAVISYFNRELGEARAQKKTLQEEVEGGDEMSIVVDPNNALPKRQVPHSFTTGLIPSDTKSHDANKSLAPPSNDVKEVNSSKRRVSVFWQTALAIHKEENPEAEDDVTMVDLMRTKLNTREAEIAEMEGLEKSISTKHRTNSNSV